MPTSHCLKKDIHYGSVPNSSENQLWRHKSGLQKGSFFLTLTPVLLMQFKYNLFSSFLALQVDHETNSDVSFPTRSIILNAKLGFYQYWTKFQRKANL